MAVAMLPVAPACADCEDYGDFLHWESYVDTPRYAMAAALTSTHAFVADADSGMQIVDITDPRSPHIVGHSSLPLFTVDVAVLNNYAFAANGYLEVLDIANPLSPQIVGEFRTPNQAVSRVTVTSTHAYLSDWYCLRILDLANPANPQLLGTVPLPDNPNGVAVSGDYAFVADNYRGLQIVDIADPRIPHIVGYVPTTGPAQDVVIANSYAYVTDLSIGLQVIDIANPLDPRIVGRVDVYGSCYGIAMGDAYVYISNSYELVAVDITDPANPLIAGSAATMFPDNGWIMDIAVQGSYAYTASNHDGLQVIDITNPHSAQPAGTVDTPGSTRGVAATSVHAYVADGSAGLQVMDIADLSCPNIVASAVTPGNIDDVAVIDTYAYAVDSYYGLAVFDVGNAEAPQLIGTLYDEHSSASYYYSKIAAMGTHAFLLSDQRLTIVDVAKPNRPRVVGTKSGDGVLQGAWDLAVTSTHAYVADGAYGLEVFDLRNVRDPRLLTRVDLPYARGIAVAGTHAYVANGGLGLQVIDITDPANPQLAGSLATPGYATHVAVAGTRAYVSNDYGDLCVIDVANPQAPLMIGSMPVSANDLATTSTHVFVSTGDPGLQVFSLQCEDAATSPTLAGLRTPAIPTALLMPQNSPNPFNPLTTFNFSLPVPGRVRLSIYDIRGERIATLLDASLPAGERSVEWKGCDSRGKPVSSGVYFARLDSPSGMRTMKVSLTR